MAMNDFERGLERYIGRERLEKLQKIKIGIAGAGGLGSNCAFNLVRSGFRKLKIVDFDFVEPANLNRQFYFIDQLGMPKVVALRQNLLRINPDLELETLQVKIDAGNIMELFGDCDVIVEAFDNIAGKTLLAEKFYSSGKLVVCASGLAGWGSSDEIKIRKIHPKFFMVGDLVTEVGRDVPPISPRVNVTAAKQADIVLDYIMNHGP
ncbi:MAG TPA: sulfur carrier protein ThiS adenylyltransferase ThiF [Thermoclostridium caenicola]|uniref:sulfur carrier protein ThiS adenylyltransferase ThiF n=1 Tax=Thermoclostridium caenicola TaxID=659425 RepID=UPI002C2193F1|nr:sulfur carrier protein ThiS adenylyltransferase ThiF [Thermoclostridium caenicola]HOK42617.1 sulfur carrier protein ThiS adenylyltransferase ThiF [Thermoclostridium caenicola]HOL84403.1 sulfur carrier protein ThiS adenylyltransferase ThiF [Thermoclostridium caenicola]HPO75934.1 sulfur carrier protein ThiS adenylyltransferase ThiF [Thermoclostridium caenicola]